MTTPFQQIVDPMIFWLTDMRISVDKILKIQFLFIEYLENDRDGCPNIDNKR